MHPGFRGRHHTRVRKGSEFMWSIENVSPEQLAKSFHYYQGALAHDPGFHCGEDCTSLWERSSEHQREVMVSAARLALMDLATQPARPNSSRKYFAKPGEAEWGC
jgi:hypothetical protein